MIFGGHKEKNRQADEKKRIKVGRLFTFVFGLVIIALSMLIPFAGGAEKVVVTLLTMVMCPLYIPSIWGTVLEAADRQPTYFCNDPYLARWYYGSRHNSRLRY